MVSTIPLFMVFALLPAGTANDERVAPRPRELHGKVLDVFKHDDVFDDDQVLISFGGEQGARKGMEVWLYRPEPKSYLGIVELVEVGSQYSIGRFKLRSLQSPYTLAYKEVRPNDLAEWHSRELPALPDILRGNRPLKPGGAIIDLTVPKEQR